MGGSTGILAIVAGSVMALGVAMPAGAVDQSGIFELDGNTVQNHSGPNTAPYDWNDLFNPSGAPIAGGGGSQLISSLFVSDANANPDLGFKKGSKEFDPVSGWTCADHPNPPKDEIVNAYAAAFQAANTAGGVTAGDTVAYFGFERESGNGDTNQGIWLFKDPTVACDLSSPTTGNGFSFKGAHQNGDLFINLSFTNGGHVNSFSVYQWPDSTTPVIADAKCGATASDTVCGIVNDGGDITTPWSGTVPQNAFTEVGIDLNQVLKLTNANLPCYGSFQMDTRASGSGVPSELKDLLGGKLQTCRNTEASTAITANNAPVSSVTVGTSVSDTVTVTNDSDAAADAAAGGPDVDSGPNLDTALVNPGGTATFTIYSGSTSKSCTQANVVQTVGPVNVAADGTATTGTLNLAPGSYEFVASYSGNPATRLLPSRSACGDEPLTVNKATPTLATTGSSTVGIGGTISDQAVVSAGVHPGDSAATLSWSLFGPFAPAASIASGSCDNAHNLTSQLAAGFTDHVADAKDATSATYNSPTYTPTAAGQYVWVAHYSGNANNNAVDGHCTDANETVLVTAPASSLTKAERDLGSGASATYDGAPPGYVTNLTSALSGDVLQYRLTYSNTGNGVASVATVTDVIPSGSVYLTGSCLPATGWLCSFASNTVTFTHSADIPGGTTSLAVGSFKVTISPAEVVVLSNTANVTSTQQTAPIPSNTVTVAGPQSSLSKAERDLGTGAAPAANPGSPSYVTSLTTVQNNHVLQYQLTYSNGGSASATNVSVTDDIPAGTTLLASSCLPQNGFSCDTSVAGKVTFSKSSVSGGAGNLVVGTFKVTVTATGGFNITNSGSVTDDVETTPILSNTVTATGPASSLAKGERDLGAAAAAGSNPASPAYTTSITGALSGDVLEYQLTYSNNGAATAANVSITDTVPAGTAYLATSCVGASGFACDDSTSTITFTNSSVPANTTGLIIGTFKVTITAAPPFTITNSGSVQTAVDSADSNSVSATGPASSVAKTERDLGQSTAGIATANPGTPVYVTSITSAVFGDVLQYALTYSNAGSAAASDVTVSDLLPAGTVYVPGSCLPLNSFACDDTTGTLAFTRASVPAATSNLPVGTFKVLVVSLGAFTVSNTGRTTSSAETSPINSNTVTAVGPVSSLSKDERNLGPGALPSADPALPVYDTSVPNALKTSVLQYQLTYSNNGNGAASSISVSDLVPAGTTLLSGSCLAANGFVCSTAVPGTVTFTRSSVAAHTTVVVGTFKVTITATPPFTISNTGAVTSAVEPSQPSNTVTATGPVSSLAKLERDLGPSATATIDPGTPAYASGITSAVVGDVLQYQLTYTNQGTADATGITINDTIPAGTTLLAGSCLGLNGFTCSVGTGKVTLTRAVAPAGTSVIAGTFKVKVVGPAPLNIVNIADVASVEDPGGSPSNTVAAGGPVSSVTKAERDLGSAATATADPSSPAYVTSVSNALTGDVIQYQLTYHNTGTGPAPSVAVTDTIPTGSVFVSGSCLGANGFTCTPPGTIISFTTASVPANTTVVAGTFKVKITATAPFSITNTASVSSGVEGTTASNPVPASGASPVGGVEGLVTAPTTGAGLRWLEAMVLIGGGSLLVVTSLALGRRRRPAPVRLRSPHRR